MLREASLRKLAKIKVPIHMEYISNIKALAILMIVFLHSGSPLFYQLNEIDFKSWGITVLYDSFVRCAVPLFLMVNGVIILSKDYQLKDWLVNKIWKRLTLPFLFYFLIVVLVNKVSLSSIFVMTKIGYWFTFYGIILTLYLLYPIIRIWLKYSKKIWIYYFLIIWFIANIINFFYPQFTFFSPNFIYLFIGFPVLGFLLAQINTEKYKLHALALYFASAFLVFIFTCRSSLNQGLPNEKFFEYLSPLVILMSLAAFVFLKNFNFHLQNKYLVEVRDFLSNHSYGIFFLHPLVISKLYFLHAYIRPVFSDWLIFFFGITITSIILFILSKVPFLKKVIG